MQFICRTKCFFDGRLWQPGEVFEGNKANKHFEKTGKPSSQNPPEEPAQNEVAKASEGEPLTIDQAVEALWPKAKEKKLSKAQLREMIEAEGASAVEAALNED